MMSKDVKDERQKTMLDATCAIWEHDSFILQGSRPTSSVVAGYPFLGFLGFWRECVDDLRNADIL